MSNKRSRSVNSDSTRPFKKIKLSSDCELNVLYQSLEFGNARWTKKLCAELQKQSGVEFSPMPSNDENYHYYVKRLLETYIHYLPEAPDIIVLSEYTPKNNNLLDLKSYEILEYVRTAQGVRGMTILLNTTTKKIKNIQEIVVYDFDGDPKKNQIKFTDREYNKTSHMINIMNRDVKALAIPKVKSQDDTYWIDKFGLNQEFNQEFIEQLIYTTTKQHYKQNLLNQLNNFPKYRNTRNSTMLPVTNNIGECIGIQYNNNNMAAVHVLNKPSPITNLNNAINNDKSLSLFGDLNAGLKGEKDIKTKRLQNGTINTNSNFSCLFKNEHIQNPYVRLQIACNRSGATSSAKKNTAHDGVYTNDRSLYHEKIIGSIWPIIDPCTDPNTIYYNSPPTYYVIGDHKGFLMKLTLK